MVNLRSPVDLLARLDRYSDRLEVQTGLQAKRGRMARQAFAFLLESRTTGTSEL